MIPTITGGHICSEEERKLLALPIKERGMPIPILKDFTTEQYIDSTKECQQLIRNIIDQEREYKFEKRTDHQIKKEIKTRKVSKHKEILNNVRLGLYPPNKNGPVILLS